MPKMTVVVTNDDSNLKRFYNILAWSKVKTLMNHKMIAWDLFKDLIGIPVVFKTIRKSPKSVGLNHIDYKRRNRLKEHLLFIMF